MNFSAKRIFGLLALSVMLVATGCGGSAVNSPEKASATQSTPAAAPAKAPEPAHQSYTIKVSGTDRVSLKHLPMFLSSFGKQDGISVDFKEFSGGTKAGEALLNKDVDFSILQVEHVLRDTSGEMRIVGLFTRYPGLALLVNTKYKDQIATLKDLVGKKVGVSGVGGASHQFLLTLLKQNGIDPSSITILPVGLNATEVFAQDKVMATVSLEPFVTQVVTSGQAVVLVDSRKPDGTRQVYGVDEIAWHALVTRPDVIQNNPKMVNQTVAALQKSLQTIATETIDNLTSQTPKEMIGADEALFRQMLQANRAAFSADGKMTRKLMEPVWSNMQQQGAAPKDKPMPFDQLVSK